MEERVQGKRVYNITADELRKKVSPLFIYQLRRVCISGLIAEYADSALDVCRVGQPSSQEALRKFKAMFLTVSIFYKQTCGATSSEWQRALPSWCGVRLSKFMRQVMQSTRDSLFLAFVRVLQDKASLRSRSRTT